MKITNLPEVTSVADSDVLVVETSSGTSKVQKSNLLSGGIALYHATFSANAWNGSSAPYTQTKTVNGVDRNTIMGDPMTMQTSNMDTNATLLEVLNIINGGYTVTGTNSVTISVSEKPACDITVYWLGVKGA